MVQRSFLNNQVSMLVPAAFYDMPSEMLRIKYPSERRPEVVLTEPTGAVNITLSHTNSRVPLNRVHDLAPILVKQFESTYPDIEWLRVDTTEIDSRPATIVDFRASATDTRIRNIMIATSLEGRLSSVTFNVTEALEREWGDRGEVAIDSIQVTAP